MKKPNTTKFGVRLKALIESQNTNQAGLAEASGVQRSTVYRLVKGDRAPSPAMLEKLAPHLGVTVADFVKGTNAEPILKSVRDVVPREEHEKLVARVMELRLQLSTAEADLGHERDDRLDAQKQIGKLLGRLEQKEADAGLQAEQVRELKSDLRRARAQAERAEKRIGGFRAALSDAASEIVNLRSQLTDLAADVQAGRESTRRASILAGVGALTGMVTVGTLLARAFGDDEYDDGYEEEED